MSDDEIEALVRNLPPVGPFEAHQRAQEDHFATWEPSVIPMPEFLRGGTVRFSCPRGCGWAHDENPGLDAANEPYRLTLPPAATSQDISDAISRQATARSDALQERVAAAIVAHDEQAHSRPAA